MTEGKELCLLDTKNDANATLKSCCRGLTIWNKNYGWNMRGRSSTKGKAFHITSVIYTWLVLTGSWSLKFKNIYSGGITLQNLKSYIKVSGRIMLYLIMFLSIDLAWYKVTKHRRYASHTGYLVNTTRLPNKATIVVMLLIYWNTEKSWMLTNFGGRTGEFSII